MNWWVIAIVMATGAAGGFINVFIGDNGLHLPVTEDGVWRPGYIGVVVVGMFAALGSWASLKAVDLVGPNVHPLTLVTTDLANALLVGFGGAKWFKSEAEKDVLQKTAAVAAGKTPDATAAAKIAAAGPFEAFKIAKGMQ